MTETVDTCFLCGDTHDRGGVMFENDQFKVLADYAPITDGHLLISPKAHFLSFRDYFINGPSQSSLTSLPNKLEKIFQSKGTLLVEHGANGSGKNGCIDHAHIHALPINNSIDIEKLRKMLSNRFDVPHFGSCSSEYPYHKMAQSNSEYLWIYDSISQQHVYFEIEQSNGCQISRRCLSLLFDRDFLPYQILANYPKARKITEKYKNSVIQGFDRKADSGVILIEGLSASGKTSVCRKLAKTLAAPYIATGLYFCGAVKALDQFFDEGQLLLKPELVIEWLNREPVYPVLEEEANEELRQKASILAQDPLVWRAIIQHSIAHINSLLAFHQYVVVDGRGMAHELLSEAYKKYYLTVPDTERKRRLMKRSGTSSDILGSYLERQVARDNADKYRDYAKAIPAETSEVIDTSNLNLDGVINLLMSDLGLANRTDALAM